MPISMPASPRTDADRLAVAEKQADGEWYIFNGNELGIIFADWCWTVFQVRRFVLTTTTRLIPQ